MKNRNYVNLNINPCKMCMPMGAVLAFKGIENSMLLLHGSQGCSTYIRRHMAGHFNEPVDIASSSLSEEGTVYGGEKNLIKGLENLVKLYNPSVIGVATTCLAETIGEDIKRITAEYAEKEGGSGPRIIPVSTPGYGGTQFEGYFSALSGMVRTLARDETPNGHVNIIAGCMSPGDVRNIKELLGQFPLQYILLPDISDTLDAPYAKEYRKIAAGGTRLRDIEKMAGARATIELSTAVPENLSPGKYLQDSFGIPLYKCPLPVGLKGTDLFLGILSELAGCPIPEKIKAERGRFIDAMIDSHKYNAEGRAVIYGEPDLVYAVGSICLENGIKPVVISTGAQSGEWKRLLRKLLQESEPEAQTEAAVETGALPLLLDDTDFETIQKSARELEANLLIGNSDGKIITEKERIPLVRIGFPIHDRVGGQRLVSTGYNGSMRLLDEITNTLLADKHAGYRKSMFEKYYKVKEEPPRSGALREKPAQKETSGKISVEERTGNHPCYSSGACKNARMHIPVAPGCNIACNYCNRKYDCVNESRPGVTSEVLTPEQAAEKFARVKEKLGNLKVIGIAGPGDALANFENTKKSLELIRKMDPDITFCLSTNGLMLPHYADEILKLGVTHVTITINAIDPAIGAKIYREINYGGKKLTGKEGVELLIKNQLEGLKYMASRGVVCKVNIVMLKDLNDRHIEAVVKKVKECGAFMTNIMPLIPARGSAFEDMPLTNNRELNALRKKCEIDLKQMYHCKQCRADAIGILGEDQFTDFTGMACGSDCSSRNQTGSRISYKFAVASKSGLLVDQHFGHVEEFYIYQWENGKINYLEKRKVLKYCAGTEECDGEQSRIDRVIKAMEDCHAVLALRIGYSPLKELEKRGISVVQTCGRIEDSIREAITGMETIKELTGAI